MYPQYLKMPIDFNKIPSPSFVLDESLLKRNLEIIQGIAVESDVKIILALKGFAMHSVFPLINQYVSATTASSVHEARLGFEEFGEEVHAYAPAYLDSEFDQWMSYCSHMTFNSLNQYNRFIDKVLDSGKDIQCGIRINPAYAEVSTDLYNPCVPGSRLGVRADAFGETLPKGITGLHFHTLCESDSYALEKTLAVVEEKFGHLLKQCTWINFGGGHLMTSQGYNTEHLIEVLKKFKSKYPHLEVILEPGAAFAWQTGYLLSTVQDVFESDGIEAVILDISVAAHMPDCLEMPYTPSIRGIKEAKEGEKRTRVGGTSCLAGDYVGDYYFPKGIAIGDQLIFEDMMHYTMVKTNFFNGVKHPSIAVWRQDDTLDIVKTFAYEDFKNKLS